MNEHTKEQLSNDLTLMVKSGLLDIHMREDGEWIYSASEYSKTLTAEQLLEIIQNLDSYELK